MAIQYNENIRIAAPAPLDKRYLSERTLLGSPLPYSGVSEVNTIIIPTERYTGLTVNINGIEYWYKEGVANLDLIEKKYDTNIPQSDYLTGATNLGFFSGYTGVQRLQLVGFGAPPMDGCYYSQYNYYYINCSGIVSLGEYPHRGYERRAYVNTARSSSWIFNAPTNTWVLSPSDVAASVGNSVGCSFVSGYPNTSWSGYLPSGSTSVTATGSLTTGGTCIYGAPVYNRIECQDLHLRTLISCSPNTMSVGYNEDYIYVSGVTSVINGANVGTGQQVFKQKTGTTLQFRTLVGSGDTVVTTSGNNLVISSTGGTGGGTYNLATPATVTVGGVTAGTQLTGCTAFQLFQKMLVVYQAPTFSSFSIGGITSPVEVGCSISGSKSFSWAFTNPSNVSGNTMCILDITSGGTLATNISTTSPQSATIGSKTFGSCGETQIWRGCAKSTCGGLLGLSQTVCALLPYYWGVCTCPGPAGSGRPAGTCAMVIGGNKVLANSATDITISFNSTSNDYLWFAVPSSVCFKTCWCCNSSLYGAIGGAVSAGGNLFPAPDYTDISVTSTCSTATYDIYISNKQSGVATLKMGYA